MPSVAQPRLSAAQFEQYKYQRLCEVDFDEALEALRVLRRYRRPDVRYCLLRTIVVTYARPFAVNRGVVGSRHTLSKLVVPRTQVALHKELIDRRNRLFAHTDFSFRRPQVARLEQRGRVAFPMGFGQLDYPALDRRLGEIERLVRAVLANLRELNERTEASL